MKRTIVEELAGWKTSAGRKPLVLKGARQVGKTWALQAFGDQFYAKEGHRCHYIDFRVAKSIHSIFQDTLDPAEIVGLLEFYLKTTIDPKHDLLIFDEIQECPQAITAMKYFEQDLNELDLIAAGSYLGLLANEDSFPVGKVNFLYMFPLTFSEFVFALDVPAFRYLDAFNFETPFPSIVHDRLLELFSLYSQIGGLPEVVAAFLEVGVSRMRDGLLAARAVQEELVEGYRADFSKYAGVVNASHIHYLFDAIPTQLANVHDASVRKFQFKDVIPRRRGLDALSGPLGWLTQSRLCIKAAIAKKAAHPLAGYCDANKFKVLLFDVGILNCMLNIPCDVFLDQKLGSFKGFMLENFVAQELFAATNRELVSWREGTAELEFLVSRGSELIPLEVKSATRNRRTKSLDAYIERYSPSVALKLTRQNFSVNEARGITTVPVYCAGRLLEYVNRRSLAEILPKED